MSTKVQPLTASPAAQPAATSLSNEEILRYSRHLILPEVGMEGQRKLKARGAVASVRADLVRRWPFMWLRPA